MTAGAATPGDATPGDGERPVPDALDGGSAAPRGWLVLELPAAEDPLLRESQVLVLVEGAWAPEPPRGVEEVGDQLRVHLPAASEDEARALAGMVVPTLLRHLDEGGTPLDPRKLRNRFQPHEAWAEHWRRGFGTRRITPRVVVTPSWEPVEPGPGEVVLVLDPGMAFGTSEHPTTRGCLRLLDPRVRTGDRVVDVGAGSGILAMAAARLGAGEVLALELDPWACAAARENAERNGVLDRVRVVARGVGPDFVPGEAPFHGIVANIETPILRPLVRGFARGLLPGGWLILSGITAEEREVMLQAATDAGFELEEEDREGDWWSGAFRLT